MRLILLISATLGLTHAAPLLVNGTNTQSDPILLAFSGSGYDGYKTWPWKDITHLAFWTLPNDDVRAVAKQNNVRLYQDAHLPDQKDWLDASKRDDFAQQKLKQVQQGKIDGVLFDYEGNNLNADEKAAYTQLTKAVSKALASVNATVFVCVGGRPSLEWRNYDYKGLADNSEFLFIMAYDMHFWDDYTCVTKGTCSPAEAPIKDVTLGVSEYLGQVSGDKLVLGLPWYGQRYDYHLLVPFNMGQIDYKYIPQILDGSIGAGKVKKKELDKDAQSWKISCGDPGCWGGSSKHHGHTIFYDDADTLKPKYALAKKNGLRGVGMWEADKLPTDSKYADDAKAMWDAITSWNKETSSAPACCFCWNGGDGSGGCLEKNECGKKASYKCKGTGSGGCSWNPSSPFGPGCM